MTARSAGLRRTVRAAILVMMSLPAAACSRGPAAAVPAPREESWCHDLHRRHLERARQGPVGLLFLGDSITQGWNGNEVWKRFYQPRNAANFGINGDRTQNVLWRIRDGELDGIRPKVVVLLIGTNNLNNATTEEIADGVGAIVAEVRHRLPEAKVLLLGIFPRGRKPDATREKLGAVNARIARLDDGAHVRFLEIGQVFLEGDGSISREIMPDFLHLSLEGYRRWAEAMEPTLREMLGESPGSPLGR